MIFKTKGIVLRSVKYGETSLVVTVFTELFGAQAYLVNGIRSARKSGNRSAMFQPASILEMEVYHNEQKSLQRIKEYSRAHLFHHIMDDVIKNGIALYMVELLLKTLRQPEQNSNLFYFCEDALFSLILLKKRLLQILPFSFHCTWPIFLASVLAIIWYPVKRFTWICRRVNSSAVNPYIHISSVAHRHW